MGVRAERGTSGVGRGSEIVIPDAAGTAQSGLGSAVSGLVPVLYALYALCVLYVLYALYVPFVLYVLYVLGNSSISTDSKKRQYRNVSPFRKPVLRYRSCSDEVSVAIKF